MTRWKREFREWAARKGMRVYAYPKDPMHWDVAKTLSLLLDHQCRSGDMEHAFRTAMLYGSSTVLGHACP